SNLPERDQRLCAKSLDRGDGRCVDGVCDRLHLLPNRRLPHARVIKSIALASLLPRGSDFWRILVIPVPWLTELPIVLRVRSCHRPRPYRAHGIILVDQRLKSGAEIDQFGVKGLRSSSW